MLSISFNIGWKLLPLNFSQLSRLSWANFYSLNNCYHFATLKFFILYWSKYHEPISITLFNLNISGVECLFSTGMIHRQEQRGVETLLRTSRFYLSNIMDGYRRKKSNDSFIDLYLIHFLQETDVIFSGNVRTRIWILVSDNIALVLLFTIEQARVSMSICAKSGNNDYFFVKYWCFY